MRENPKTPGMEELKPASRLNIADAVMTEVYNDLKETTREALVTLFFRPVDELDEKQGPSFSKLVQGLILRESGLKGDDALIFMKLCVLGFEELFDLKSLTTVEAKQTLE